MQTEEIRIPTRPGRCPHCGRRTGMRSRTAWLYGCPIRACGKCGGKYLEKCYHEVEIDGFQETDVSLKASNRQLWAALGLVILMLALNIMAVTEGRLGFLIISVVLFIKCLQNSLKIKNGKKAEEMENERLASRQRLENPEYARILRELGYNVPEKYRQE